MKRYKGSLQERSRPLMLLVGFLLCVGTVTASGDPDRFDYELLATNRTSTMEKEMNQAAGEGFGYAGQTVFETALGGKETVVIMERRSRRGQVRVQAARNKEDFHLAEGVDSGGRERFQAGGNDGVQDDFRRRGAGVHNAASSQVGGGPEGHVPFMATTDPESSA